MAAHEALPASGHSTKLARTPLQLLWHDVGRPSGLGQRLAVLHSAGTTPARGLVVHAHALADEMNKSRRMVGQQAQRLARDGFTVLLLDLLGCGDSDGEFAQATWDHWVQDLVQAARLGRSIEPDAPLWWWGTRTGALLASQAAQRQGEPCSLLFWQPTPSGATVLQQFLRLKAAAEMLNQGGKGVVDQLKHELSDGQTVEVAGYELTRALTDGLADARLAPFEGLQRVVWLEVSAQPDATFSPASSRSMQAWSAASPRFDAQIVHGGMFWQSVEIEDAPALWDATCAQLGSAGTPAGPVTSP